MKLGRQKPTFPVKISGNTREALIATSNEWQSWRRMITVGKDTVAKTVVKTWYAKRTNQNIRGTGCRRIPVKEFLAEWWHCSPRCDVGGVGSNTRGGLGEATWC